MFIAFIVGGVSYTYLRILFLSDKKIIKCDKIPFFMLSSEIGYIIDLPEDRKSKYLKSMRLTKTSMLIFAICFLLLIIETVVSAF